MALDKSGDEPQRPVPKLLNRMKNPTKKREETHSLVTSVLVTEKKEKLVSKNTNKTKKEKPENKVIYSDRYQYLANLNKNIGPANTTYFLILKELSENGKIKLSHTDFALALNIKSQTGLKKIIKHLLLNGFLKIDSIFDPKTHSPTIYKIVDKK